MDAAYDALYDAALGTDAVWVATNGSDTSGNGSQATPFATIGRALSAISGGGQIIVRDGTYTVGTGGFVNQHASGSGHTVPAGSAGAYTRIRAENRFGVRLVQPNALYYGAVMLITSPYVWLDGFVIDKQSMGCDYAVELAGDKCRLTRCIVIQRGGNDYGGAVRVQATTGVLVQDVHAYGWSRYVFQCGRSNAETACGQHVFRRCVSYLAGGKLGNPTASFAFYGSDVSSYGEQKEVVWENCYEIDSPPMQANSDRTKWGAWYHPKSTRSLKHIGCGALNGGSTYGAFSGGDTSTIQYVDSFVANWSGTAAFRQSGNTSSGVFNCTVHNVAGGVQVGGVAQSNVLSAGVVHPVMRIGGAGAEQLYAVGEFCSHWGDPGYDSVSSVRLWPFPYESFIAAEFGNPLPKPSGFYPSDVTATKDPFAGVSLGGHANTLTRRIWEAAGTQIPDLTTVY